MSMSHKVKLDLKSWMGKTGRGVQETADYFGVSPSYIYYILEGIRKPGRDLLAKMASAGIDPMFFLGGSECSSIKK